MRLRIAPKFVARVSAVLMLTASLVCASVSTGRHAVHIDSAFAKQESERNVDDQPLSPRLAALQDRLKAGDRHALDIFWKEIAESGAPMIEPVVDGDRDVLVTILWRGTNETRSVFVFHLPRVEKPISNPSQRFLWTTGASGDPQRPANRATREVHL